MLTVEFYTAFTLEFYNFICKKELNPAGSTSSALQISRLILRREGRERESIERQEMQGSGVNGTRPRLGVNDILLISVWCESINAEYLAVNDQNDKQRDVCHDSVIFSIDQTTWQQHSCSLNHCQMEMKH